MHGTPMQVAIALGIMVSQLSHPHFRHRFLTFESQPQWVDLSGCEGVVEKVQKTAEAGWGGSTDFAAACEMILEAAVAAKLSPGEVPDLIVFSDMQFNQACGAYDDSYYSTPYCSYWGGYGSYGRCSRGVTWETHLERLTRRFHEAGMQICGQPYAPPRVIFWNLRGDTVGFPCQADAPNTQMISGFSSSLLQLVLAGQDLTAEEVVGSDGKPVREGPTPYETLRKALDDPQYDAVRVAVAEEAEGPLAQYCFEVDGFAVV